MKSINVDLVIIGSGMAGLSAALQAQTCCSTIAVLDKGHPFASGSTFNNFNSRWGMTYSQSSSEMNILLDGINRISKGTNNPELSKIVVEDSYLAFNLLQQYGVRFLRKESGEVKRFSPCFIKMPLAAVVESTKGVADTLLLHIDNSIIRFFSYHSVFQLLVANDKCVGCVAVDDQGEDVVFHSKATILATGGDCACNVLNIVDEGLTGDGYSMLFDVGVKLKNMQYQQRVWENAIIVHERFSSAMLCRDDIFFEDYLGNLIDLEFARKKFGAERSTHVPLANLLEDKQIDDKLLAHIPHPRMEYAVRIRNRDNNLLFSILPYCQACNGGVEIGINGETPIPGLYAAGEVTTGMHGGDRVGGMMITSAIVFGKRAATHACNSYIK